MAKTAQYILKKNLYFAGSKFYGKAGDSLLHSAAPEEKGVFTRNGDIVATFRVPQTSVAAFIRSGYLEALVAGEQPEAPAPEIPAEVEAPEAEAPAEESADQAPEVTQEPAPEVDESALAAQAAAEITKSEGIAPSTEGAEDGTEDEEPAAEDAAPKAEKAAKTEKSAKAEKTAKPKKAATNA